MRVVRPDDRRVGVEDPVLDPGQAVDPVLVDARDLRSLIVEDGLALDDRGEGQHLVEGQATLRGDIEPVGPDGRVELVEHQADELLGRRIREHLVARRPEEPLERRVRRHARVGQDLLQPRVVVDEVLRRRGREVVELLDVHLQGQRLELGRDLLEPEARPQAEIHVRDGRRIEECRDQVVRRQVPAQQERPLLELVGELALDRVVDECAFVADEAVTLEARRDRARRVAVLDDELDLRRVARGRLRQGCAQVLADEVLHERHREGRGVVRRPAQDRPVDDGPQGRQGHDQDERGQDDREHEELEDPADAAARPAAVVAAATSGRLDHRRQDVGRVGVGVVWVRVRGTIIPWASAGADRHARFSVWLPGRGRDERIPARVSSSSWRMMAAASRSTRAR